jgi:hypothetical protein
MPEPQEPPCPSDRKPHKERVNDIDNLLLEGQTGAICIDDTPEHIAWYLHELAKYPRLTVVHRELLAEGVYLIKVRKEPSPN